MSHSKIADQFNRDFDRTSWHDETLWLVRKKRDAAMLSVDEFQLLRQRASDLKEHTLGYLTRYLLEFESNAMANGIKVHWATDAREHNEIIAGIIRKAKAERVVKSKSMLTEECHLNEYLKSKNIDVIDTDLGERIIQLRNESPSHIVLPAVHLKKEEVARTFHRHLGTEKSESSPERLVMAAREHLRPKFIHAEVAITGCNFAIAETGGIVVCTNEGNADLGVHCAKIHIASIGIEKVIPRWEDLAVFTRLLARSATGQPITIYTSHFVKPQQDKEIHFVLVDNGRTRQLAKPDFRNSLKCIRCGACMNTCPVYRRSGGHSYHSTIPGPIGAILNPGINLADYRDLPFASTLCGSCSDVCPVKIDIHQQLYKWRQIIREENKMPLVKKTFLKVMAFVMARPYLFKGIGTFAAILLKILPHKVVHWKTFNAWAKNREVPIPPESTFKQWYSRNKK